MKELIIHLSNSQIAPRFMYTFLLKNNDIDVDQQTVANAIREGKISERHA